MDVPSEPPLVRHKRSRTGLGFLIRCQPSRPNPLQPRQRSFQAEGLLACVVGRLGSSHVMHTAIVTVEVTQ
jgi:hypothetical protein